MSAVASATPSTTPMASAEAPRLVTMKTGSRLWTISDETSIRRLTKPRTHTVRGTRRTAVAGAVMPAALTSAMQRRPGSTAPSGDDAHLNALAATLAGVVDPVEHELAARLGAQVELQVGVRRDSRPELGAKNLGAVIAADEQVDDVLRDGAAHVVVPETGLHGMLHGDANGHHFTAFDAPGDLDTGDRHGSGRVEAR